MPFNKHLVEEKSTLLQNKLEKLATNLTSGANFQTEEEIIAEVVRVIEGFYKDINEPIFNPEIVAEGDVPDPDLYNRIWNNVLDDLSIVFTELETLEGLTLNNFNFITTESSRLLARLKNVSSQLGDYILYSSNPTRDAFYFKDSFNDLSRIDSNSSLLNKPECEVDQDQGIVMLPVNKEKDSIIKITAEPIINTSSNGVVGNNQEVNAAFNGNTKAVLDNNPDTWFEYEKVVATNANVSDPLILDITINLGNEQVVNYIRINPNNFGTKTTILIDTIETSLDGKVYTNVKDDIPIGDFLTKDEDNVFVLAPSTSKYAGQGIFNFSPRKAKYVHFIFKQSEPYIIKTPNGDRLRFAIGLRDIDIRGIQFLSEGEFISRPFEFTQDIQIRKVALDANQDPLEESVLASIKYFISPDNGQTWNEIRPKSFEGFANEESTIKEILDFNGSDEKTINTLLPVTSLRLKGGLKREDAAFENGVSSFRKEIKSRSEIHKVPDDAPFDIVLDQPPVEGTIEVIDPQYGSRGRPQYPYVIAASKSTSALKSYFYLPFTSFKRQFKKVSSGGVYSLAVAPASDWMHILVGGEEWTMATQELSSYNASFSTAVAYRLFRFNPSKGTLQFGHGHDTMQPPAGAPIEIYLDAERLYPTEISDNHTAPLDFKTSNDKDQFTLKRYEEELDASQLVPKKASIIRLEHENITDLGTIASTLSALGYTSQVTYLNGKDELISTSKWSIDTEHGVIYLGTETSASSNSTIDYKYQDITELTNNDWDWASGASLRDSIKVKESAWKTIHNDDQTLPTTNGIHVIDLPHFAIVKGTLELELLDGSAAPDDSLNPLLKEVPFIDGAKEFGDTVKQIAETIPFLSPGSDSIASFSLKHPIVSDTAYKVTFSKKGIFVTQHQALDTLGDWYIDRDIASPTYRKLFVRRASPTDTVTVKKKKTGYVIYYYNVPNTNTTGLYSIDYKLGRIYMQRPMLGGNWTLKGSYQYTDYRAEYNIARVVPPASYEINRTDKTIKFKDGEVLNRSGIPREKLGEQLPYYQFTYDYVSVTRENVADLKDFFSPILKDYVLKVITKDRLI